MKLGREPIFAAGSSAVGIVLLLNLLVSFGVPITDDQRDAIRAFTVWAGPLLVAVITWLWARRHTTPLNSPRNADGEALMTARKWQIADRAKLTSAIESARQARQKRPAVPPFGPAVPDDRTDAGEPVSDLRGLPIPLSALAEDGKRHGLTVVKTGTPGMMYVFQESSILYRGPDVNRDTKCDDTDCAVCGETSMAKDIRFAMCVGTRVRDEL